MKLFKEIIRGMFIPLSIINKIIPKREQILLYSNLGFRDNVKAFYNYLIKNNYNEKYRIVISTNEKIKNSTSPKNVVVAGLYTGVFYYLISKYVFYSFGKYPIEPANNQEVVNLWHGMPIKKIGNAEVGKERIKYNYFTKIIVTSEMFVPIMMKCFNCTKDQVIITGQPRNDELFHNEQSSNIVRGNNKLIITWLPTYREEVLEIPLPGFSYDDLVKLNQEAKRLLIKIIVKVHPLQKIKNMELSFTNIVFYTQKEIENKNLSLYKLLKGSDALITDYSSVYFDYLLLDRPMAFYSGDKKSYGEERGFLFTDLDEIMPGEKITDVSSLIRFITNLSKNNDIYKERRHLVNNKVNKYCDDKSSERIAKVILK